MKPPSVILLWAVAAILLVALPVGCRKSEPEPTAEESAPAAEESETGGQAGDPTAEAIAQKTCPVMGGPINPDIYVDHEGRRVYFCCQACVAKFKANPEKYLAKLDEQMKGADETGQDP